MRVHADSPVSELMSRRLTSISPGTTMPALIRLFEQHHVSGFPVVDEKGRLVGVVSQTDLIRRCINPIGDEGPGFFFQELAEQLSEASGVIDAEALIIVADIMTSTVVTASPTETVGAVAKRMAERHVHRVVIVGEHREPVGIVTTMDMLRALAG